MDKPTLRDQLEASIAQIDAERSCPADDLPCRCKPGSCALARKGGEASLRSR